MLTYPKNLEGSITILGEHGTVRVGGVAVSKIEHWEFATPHPDDAEVADAVKFANDSPEPTLAELEATTYSGPFAS